MSWRVAAKHVEEVSWTGYGLPPGPVARRGAHGRCRVARREARGCGLARAWAERRVLSANAATLIPATAGIILKSAVMNGDRSDTLGAGRRRRPERSSNPKDGTAAKTGNATAERRRNPSRRADVQAGSAALTR